MQNAISPIPHAEDLAKKALKIGCAATKFLTPADAAEIRTRFAGRQDVTVAAEGGFMDAERVRILFLQPEWGSYAQADILLPVKLNYRTQDSLTHRDVLGALMNLGIKREVVGDIQAAGPPPVLLVCLPEFASYIIENLQKVGRVGVQAEIAAPEELTPRQDRLESKTLIVSSLRLDGVISELWNLSRSKACDLIAAGKVQVNHAECAKPDKQLAEGSLLSVRGFGRARILSIDGKTRKDRLRVSAGIYL